MQVRGSPNPSRQLARSASCVPVGVQLSGGASGCSGCSGCAATVRITANRMGSLLEVEVTLTDKRCP